MSISCVQLAFTGINSILFPLKTRSLPQIYYYYYFVITITVDDMLKNHDEELYNLVLIKFLPGSVFFPNKRYQYVTQNTKALPITLFRGGEHAT